MMQDIRIILWQCLVTLVLSVIATPVDATAGDIVAIAGNGREEYSGDGGQALQAGFSQPFGIGHGPDGALYICEFTGHIIRRMDEKTGIISTYAGTGRKAGYSGDGGPATDSQMNLPHELQFDAAGNMYISDMNGQSIRRVDWKTKVITSYTGSGKAGFEGDGGPASKALFKSPIAVTLRNSPAEMFVCDIGNHRVRRIDMSTGVIETFAGTGKGASPNEGDPVAGTPLNGPRTVAIEPDGSLIVVLREGNSVFRLNRKNMKYEHLAGSGKKGFTGDGGNAREATLSGPKGVALDAAGNIYLADTENHSIRVIHKATGNIDTLVGNGKAGPGVDGDPKKCQLRRPHGVYVDAAGTLYIGDSENNQVRKLKLN